MELNSRLFQLLDWPDTPTAPKTTQPEKQAEELPTEEKN